MRLPRDLSGRELGKRLETIGYRFNRQVGSHMRFTLDEDPKHSVTIPDHKELRAGTLRQTLRDVSQRVGMDVDELIGRILL